MSYPLSHRPYASEHTKKIWAVASVQAMRHMLLEPKPTDGARIEIVAVEDGQARAAALGIEHHARHPYVRRVRLRRAKTLSDWPWDHDHLLAKSVGRRLPNLLLA